MEELDNKTIMCSVFFLDIVGYSKKSVMGQISLKERFNSYLSAAIRDVPITDRIILDTGDGAAINFLGDIEDALKAALSLRESLLNEDPNLNHPLLVRMGINLGPVRLVRDINGQPNIVGDGINVAQRIMGFADANQVLVSRSYFDAVSRLSPQYTDMFHFQGSRTDKHVREHEVYAIGYSGDKTNPRLGRQSKNILAKAMDGTRTGLRPVSIGFKFLHTNLLQGFLRVGPVKRVLYAVLVVLALLVILEFTEEMLLGNGTLPISSDNSAEMSNVPKAKLVVVTPASTPSLVANEQPNEGANVALLVQPLPTKQEVAIVKSTKDIPIKDTPSKDMSLPLTVEHKNHAYEEPAKKENIVTLAVDSNPVDDEASGSQESNISVSCYEGSEVFIGGTRKGKVSSSPLVIPVLPGRHLVIVSHAKGMDWSLIKLQAGKTVFVNPDFCKQ